MVAHGPKKSINDLFAPFNRYLSCYVIPFKSKFQTKLNHLQLHPDTDHEPFPCDKPDSLKLDDDTYI